jgi:hypothetical protein
MMIYKTNNKTRKVLVAALLLSFFVISLASAFGIGFPYTRADPLSMYPGETTTVSFSLGNKDAEGGMDVKGEVSSTGNIATLEKETYNIPYNGEITPNMIIKIPVNAKVGDSYTITVTFSQTNAGGSGESIAIGGMATRVFDVVVTEKPVTPAPPEEPKSNAIFWVIGIIVVIVIIALIIYFVIKKKE